MLCSYLIDLMGFDPINSVRMQTAWTYAMVCLIVLTAFLTAMLYIVRYRTVRIYNWSGSRYCYLGRAALHRNGGGHQVYIGERMADLSYTTLYRICPSRSFVRKNRYGDMMLCAGDARCMLHVDECMRQSIYYKQARIK